jgi:hypothetical protein
MILHKAKLIDQNFPNNQMIYQCMMQYSGVDYALKTLQDNPIKELLTAWKESKRSHWIRKIFKSNCVANFLSKLDPHFFGHPCSNCLSSNTANIYKRFIMKTLKLYLQLIRKLKLRIWDLQQNQQHHWGL